MNGSDEVDLRNLYARAQFARRKRNADNDLIFDLVDFFDDNEVEEIKTRESRPTAWRIQSERPSRLRIIPLGADAARPDS